MSSISNEKPSISILKPFEIKTFEIYEVFFDKQRQDEIGKKSTKC